VIRYRVGCIDDFLNAHSYVDYRDYGALQVWGASRTSGPRERQQSDDAIHVFLDLEKVGVFGRREDANAMILQLLRGAPVPLEQYWYVFAP
jgi:hypothetical protein